VFVCVCVFSLFYRLLEENEAFLEVSSLKSKFGKTIDFDSVIDCIEPVLERPSQGTSAVRTCARKRKD
jgi:hypothetical protein